MIIFYDCDITTTGIMLGQRLPPVTGGGTAHVEGVPQFTLGKYRFTFCFTLCLYSIGYTLL